MGPAAGPPMEEEDIINILHRHGFMAEATTLIIGDYGLFTFDGLHNLDDVRCESLVQTHS